MSRERVLQAAMVALLVLYAGVALYVLVDDRRLRAAGQGRWARLDQLLADAEENVSVLKATTEAAEQA